MTRAIALLGLAVGACTSWIWPQPPMVARNAEALDVLARWQASAALPTPTGRCIEMLQGTLVQREDRDGLIEVCGRDEPGHCPDGVSPRTGRYGCTAGCTAVTEDKRSLVIVISDKIDDQTLPTAIHHEATHGLAECMLYPIANAGDRGDPYHQIPALWGTGGISPL